MRIYVTDQQGVRHELQAESGWRVMEIIRDWEVGIKAECGGCCLCATCHVYVADVWLDKIPAMRNDEQEMIEESQYLQKNSRLSCQIIMSEALDGLEVSLAPDAAVE